jgi:hypothetical protein
MAGERSALNHHRSRRLVRSITSPSAALMTASAAADLMRVTLRQTHRLLKRYRDGGAPAIANRRRGRPSNNRLSDVVRDHAFALVRELKAQNHNPDPPAWAAAAAAPPSWGRYPKNLHNRRHSIFESQEPNGTN